MSADVGFKKLFEGQNGGYSCDILINSMNIPDTVSEIGLKYLNKCF